MRKEGVGNGNLTGFAIVLDREFDPAIRTIPYHSSFVCGNFQVAGMGDQGAVGGCDGEKGATTLHEGSLCAPDPRQRCGSRRSGTQSLFHSRLLAQLIGYVFPGRAGEAEVFRSWCPGAQDGAAGVDRSVSGPSLQCFSR